MGDEVKEIEYCNVFMVTGFCCLLGIVFKHSE